MTDLSATPGPKLSSDQVLKWIGLPVRIPLGIAVAILFVIVLLGIVLFAPRELNPNSYLDIVIDFKELWAWVKGDQP